MGALSFGFAWAAYAVGSWGWILLKGYDITFKQWVSPLTVYSWPRTGSPGTIPASQVFPTGNSAQAASGSPPATTAAKKSKPKPPPDITV